MVLWHPRPIFKAPNSVKNLRIKQYVFISSCQDIIVRKFCPDLFLVQIPCQWYVSLSGYIKICSWKFRKILQCAKNAVVISILFLSTPRTQEKDYFATLNTHTHTHTHTHTPITRSFLVQNFSMQLLFPTI